MKKGVKLLPKLSKTVQNVMDLTFYTKAPMWYNNFAENLATIRKGKDIKELPRLDGKPCICLGAGPSVWKHNHLELLKKWKGTILCCDRMLIECLKRDIVPFAVATVDGDKRIKEFYDDPVVDKYRDEVKAVFSAVTVHPEVVRRCPFEKYWFVPIYDDPRKPKSLTFALYYLSGEKSLLVTGGNVGTFMIGAGVGGFLVLAGMEFFGVIILVPHIINFIMWIYWSLNMHRYPHVKFGRLNGDGTIQAPNKLSMKYFVTKSFHVSELGAVLICYAITAAFGVLGLII